MVMRASLVLHPDPFPRIVRVSKGETWTSETVMIVPEYSLGPIYNAGTLGDFLLYKRVSVH